MQKFEVLITMLRLEGIDHQNKTYNYSWCEHLIWWRTKLIGGMKITIETIRFKVKYRPLDMMDNINFYLLLFNTMEFALLNPGSVTSL